MKIKNIVSQHRRDFTAIYICGHCGHEEKGEGYDDMFFHENVIPDMKCGKCGMKETNYQPRATKYPEGMQI
jgi:ribosomal protein S27AE